MEKGTLRRSQCCTGSSVRSAVTEINSMGKINYESCKCFHLRNTIAHLLCPIFSNLQIFLNYILPIVKIMFAVLDRLLIFILHSLTLPYFELSEGTYQMYSFDFDFDYLSAECCL